MPAGAAPPSSDLARVRAPSLEAFLSYGFRPFFALAAAWAVLALAAVLGALALGAWPGEGIALGRWHGHEMLFGFVAAAIAGFLLTAVPTWTGTRALGGWPLVALAALWTAGRVVMWPWLPLHDTPWVLLDAAFFPSLAIGVGIALVRARNYRNFQFMLLLALLTAADLAFLAGRLGWTAVPPFDPIRFAANLVMLMIAIVGGRILPLFTRNALLQRGVKVDIGRASWLDRTSIAALVAVIAVDIVRQDTPIAGWVSAVAALLLLARMSRWHGHRTLGIPIVWILHVGYVWIAVALALKAAWLLVPAPWAANWLHALTAGAFGTMILGVMTRVALGHTGRALAVGAPIVAAYWLVIVGAALRVLGPAALPAHYVLSMSAALSTWVAAFAIFLVVYLPILIAPRPDRD